MVAVPVSRVAEGRAGLDGLGGARARVSAFKAGGLVAFIKKIPHRRQLTREP